MKDMADSVLPPQPRDYAGVNWIGFWTLYLKEVRRFWKVGTQTVMAPVVTALLYMMVFVVAVKGARPPVGAIPFAQFVGPGLIMMQILNNAFANSSSSLLQAKMMGLTPDFMTPPLSAEEQVAAFMLGAATRGMMVGFVTFLAVFALALVGHTPMTFAHPWAILYFGIGASLCLGLLGCFAGLWSEKFDHLAAMTNFIIMPMTFLSGTFYLVDRLPEPFRTISHYNPFFYLIDGFRYGFIGHAESNIAVGTSVIAGLTLALLAASWGLFKTGYRLKT
jgi:ABC-2 type transport system permease protein